MYVHTTHTHMLTCTQPDSHVAILTPGLESSGTRRRASGAVLSTVRVTRVAAFSIECAIAGIDSTIAAIPSTKEVIVCVIAFAVAEMLRVALSSISDSTIAKMHQSNCKHHLHA